nr:MAG TPA: hypothetical protein [Caudoviricetes sp.]
MAIDLKKILETMKKTYSFRIKIAADRPIDNEWFKNFDTIMTLKGMTKRTKPEALPLASAPTDFARLKGFYGTIYKCDIDFEYPITENQIKNEICSLNHIDRAFVIVRTLESPLEEIDDNYLEYNEEDYIPILLNDEEQRDINVDELTGDNYNKELVKALQSKEAQKYQQHFSEVDLAKHTNTKK